MGPLLNRTAARRAARFNRQFVDRSEDNQTTAQTEKRNEPSGSKESAPNKNLRNQATPQVIQPDLNSLRAPTVDREAIKNGNKAEETTTSKESARPAVTEPRKGQATSSTKVAEDTKQRSSSDKESSKDIVGTRLHAETKQAADEARALKAEMEALTKVPAVEEILSTRQSSTAFQKIYQSYKRYLPETLADRESVIKASGLEDSRWGSKLALAPEDPKRPGILMTCFENETEALDQVVTMLRNSTTSKLLITGGFREMHKTRANSILIVKPGDMLDRAVETANKGIPAIGQNIAANALVRAERQTGRGLFASAQNRVERAARGRLGSRRFKQELATGITEATEAIKVAREDTIKLMGAKAREYAYGSAATLKDRADEVGKPSHLLGFEVDFSNKRPTGVEYFVITDEGKTYLLPNVGKNFQDPNGSFLPAAVYASFNVKILRAYQKNNSISREEFYSIAMEHSIFPTEEGKMVYLDPKKFGAQATAFRNALQKVYHEKKRLTDLDLAAVLSADPSNE